jgi:hypothetical protein
VLVCAIRSTTIVSNVRSGLPASPAGCDRNCDARFLPLAALLLICTSQVEQESNQRPDMLLGSSTSEQTGNFNELIFHLYPWLGKATKYGEPGTG